MTRESWIGLQESIRRRTTGRSPALPPPPSAALSLPRLPSSPARPAPHPTIILSCPLTHSQQAQGNRGSSHSSSPSASAVGAPGCLCAPSTLWPFWKMPFVEPEPEPQGRGSGLAEKGGETTKRKAVAWRRKAVKPRSERQCLGEERR